MNIEKPEKKLQVLELISQGIQRNYNLKEKLGLSDGRIGQLISKLRDDELIVTLSENHELTKKGYKLLKQELMNDSFDITRLEEKTVLEDVVVYFIRKPVAAVAEEGWREKFAEISNEEFVKLDDEKVGMNEPSFIRVNEYNTVLLKPDSIQIGFGKVYANNLIQAKDEVIDRAEEIIKEFEKKSNETLQVRNPKFDGLITYQSIKNAENLPHFRQGREVVTSDEVIEKSEEEQAYNITASKTDETFRISLPMTEPRRRAYKELKDNMRAQPEQFNKILPKLEELEERLERLEGRR